jgi:hypothetical protein
MTVEHVLAIIGAIVPIFSAIASALNQHARTAEAPSANMAKAQVIVNTLALNLDKVRQAAAVVQSLKASK